MNRAAAEAHFNAYVGKLLERLPARDRTAFKHVVADSYEMGPQNWTDGFGALFRERYRYDPRPWFPTLSGRVVGTADVSDRFLWDLRRLVADRIALDYVGGLRDLCHRHGLRLWLENYGHWGFPAEFLQYGGQADQVGGEFWATGELGSIELRAASSAAHLYGKPVISAEAFTGGPLFASTPWSLKCRGDWAATEGINHFVLHVYIHQPDERRPGMNAWFGTEFNRHNTWFEASRAWVDYLRRTHFLLQQGRPVADVAYFIGEDTPKMTGVRRPELPAGYDFDHLNAEVILQRLEVKDRHWVLPDGTAYRLLVLPPLDTMRPAVLRKLGELVAAGGALLGTPPQRSPSLEDYPACDQQVRELAAALWRKCDGVTVKETRYRRGRVFRGLDVSDALARLEVPPDVAGLEGTPVRWTHRRGNEAEIYFLSNQSDSRVEVTPAFRIRGRAPELWHADSAERERPALFELGDDATRVPLRLEPRDAVFVLFPDRKERTAHLVRAERLGKAGAERPPARFDRTADGRVTATLWDQGAYLVRFSDGRTNTVQIPDLPAPRALVGPWEVHFPPGMGVPAVVRFTQLVSWPEHPDRRIRSFSGTATYLGEFSGADRSGRLLLDLGQVEGIAEVRVNDRDFGVLWKPPFRLDISDVPLRETNSVQVKVTNVWLNRLLTARPPRTSAITGDNAFQPWLAANVTAQLGPDPIPSGLLGPVRLIPGRQVNLK